MMVPILISLGLPVAFFLSCFIASVIINELNDNHRA